MRAAVASQTDRFLLAIEWLNVRYEERNGFLSDSDVLDAADLFTTSDLDAAHGDDVTDKQFQSLTSDRCALVEALFAVLEVQS